jgi:transposase
MPRQHSKDFKVEALQLLQQPGATVAATARNLGVAQSQLYKWRKQLAEDGGDAFVGKGHMAASDEKIRALEREIRQLRMERDILKKATAFFVRESSGV